MNQRLLIIDDAAEVHRLLESRLQAEDLILDFVDQAQAGFDRAKSTQPDLILLDVRMPEISGFELCRLLKADPCTAHIPVIFLSGPSTTSQNQSSPRSFAPVCAQDSAPSAFRTCCPSEPKWMASPDSGTHAT